MARGARAIGAAAIGATATGAAARHGTAADGGTAPLAADGGVGPLAADGGAAGTGGAELRFTQATPTYAYIGRHIDLIWVDRSHIVHMKGRSRIARNMISMIG